MTNNSGFFIDSVFRNNIDFERHAIKVALFSPNLPLPDYRALSEYAKSPFDVIYEIGTPTGGLELTGKFVIPSGDSIIFDADDLQWPHQTIQSANYALIYDQTEHNAAIACLDFGSNFSTVGGGFTLQWNAGGVFTVDFNSGQRLAYPTTWELG